VTAAGSDDDDETEKLDYRFTLANERTFLAWIRTSLALLAGGVAVHTLVASFRLPGLRRAIALSCVALAVLLAVGAYRHWSDVESAMRRGASLPRTILIPVLSVGVAVVSILAAVAVAFR
jgi:putative membrane protein